MATKKRWTPTHFIGVGVLVLLAVLVAQREPKPAGPTRPDVRAPLEARPAPANASSAAAPDAPAPAPDPLPEAGPHPDFPTPRRAGTEQIFLVEEPPRGPWLTELALPDRGELAWTAHAHCEDTPAGVVCSAKLEATPPGARHWMVGRNQDGTRLLAEERLADATPLQRIWLERHPDGAPSRMVFLDASGTLDHARFFEAGGRRYSERNLDGSNPLPGCGGMALVIDGEGRAVERTCLQWTGEPMLDTDGVAITRYERDARGFLARQSHFDKAGQPVAGRPGAHAYVYTRDAAGREVRRQALGLDGQPVALRGDGCHGFAQTYDAAGSVLTKRCLDARGETATFDEGRSLWLYERDGRGCLTEERYQNQKGWPAAGFDGLYGARYEVDARCRRLSRTCLDAQGQPKACSPGGPARFQYGLDAAGRVVSTRHFDAAGASGRSASCLAFEHRKELDRLGREVRMSYFDAAGQPLECSRTGFYGYTSEFDDAGREAERRFFGKQGEPATNLGTTVRRFVYDNYDHERDAVNYDLDGKRVPSNGAAIRRKLYDDHHRLFGLLLYDAEEVPARYTGCYTGVDCPSRPWHAVRLMRNALGTVVTNLYFGQNGQLIETMSCRTKRCWE